MNFIVKKNFYLRNFIYVRNFNGLGALQLSLV